MKQPVVNTRPESLLKLCRIYLSLVPLVVAILGFGVGHISYTIYLPVWVVNACLMTWACRELGLQSAIKAGGVQRQLASGAFFLILPWILISIFFGFGPPPETPAAWVALTTEQQVRYSLLVVAGISIAIGFGLTRGMLKNSGESLYATMGYVMIMVAIPLFLVNMLFWGFYLTESFRLLEKLSLEKMPDWFQPVRKLFGMISMVEVALTYLATMAFAMAMHSVGWIKQSTRNIYCMVSLVAFLVIVLSAFCPEPFITAGFVVSIPAIPFIMPYFMGIKLLRRAA